MITTEDTSPPVLIIDLAKQYGGAEVRVFTLASELHGRHPYAAAVLNNSPLHKKLVTAGLSIIALTHGRGNPLMFFALRRIIRSNNFKIVDAHNPQSQFWGLSAAAAAGVPVRISTVHSSYGITDKGIKKFLYEGTLRINKFFKCRFVAVSESVSAYLQSLNIDKKRIAIISNGIKITESPEGDCAVRKLFGIREDDYLIAVVGRLEPVKGHKYFIQAMKNAVKKHPRLHCLIIGAGRMKKELQSLVIDEKLEGNIHFTGFSNEVREILNCCNAFCMPSLSEGHPYALLEACACALPVLATATGGILDLLENNRTGLLVQPGSSEALERGILRLIENPAESAMMGKAAYKMVSEKFSIERMMMETLKVYGIKKHDA